MQRKQNPQLVPFAKKLRKDMTKEERHLWYDFLRPYPVRVTRQKVLGKYIVDFYCAEAKLVIELDGSQHFEDEGLLEDKERAAFLAGYDLRVIHIPNNEIKRNFDGVCEYIDLQIRERANGSPAQARAAENERANGSPAQARAAENERANGSPAQGELSAKLTEGS